MPCIMEVGYKKDLRNNYMVIDKSTDIEYSSFCIKMLEKQEIEGLLLLEQKQIDNKKLLYYDITGKQSINNILEKTTLSVNALKILCSGIIQAIEMAYEYLLPEDDFILAPDFIYQDIVSGKPFLCLYPGYGINIKDQMGQLMEFLMNKVDYNDREAVYLVYRLYAVSKEEGYTFGHLKEVLFDNERNRQENSNVKEEGYISDSHAINTHVAARDDIKNIKDERVPLLNRAGGNIKESRIPVVMEKVEGEEEIAYYSPFTCLMAAGCVLAGIAVIVISIAGKIIYNSLGTRIDYSKLAALLIILACLESYLMSKLFNKKNKITKIIKTKEYIDPRADYNDYSSYKIKCKNNIMDLISRFFKIRKENCDNSSDSPVNTVIKNPDENRYAETNANIHDEAVFDVFNNTHGDKCLNIYDQSKTCSCANIHNDNTGDEIKYKDNNADMEGVSPTCLLNFPEDNFQDDNFAEDNFPKENIPKENERMPVLKAMDKTGCQDIAVSSYPFFIGKLKKNVDYCLDSETVSRYHAKITKEGESFYITDLNSTNGTFINDEPLQTYQKKEIKNGDIIAFANIKYQFIIKPMQL